MRQRNWFLTILFGGMILGIYLTITNEIFFAVMGAGFGSVVLMIIYMFTALDYENKRDTKRLLEENKYVKSVKCFNCGTHHYFEVQKGVCMMEFLQSKKCTNCSCELKVDTITERSSEE